MRILVLSNLYPPDFLGGYELGCRQAVDGLAGRGHDVLVLTSVPRLPAPAQAGVRRALHFTDVYTPSLQEKKHPVVRWVEHAAASYVDAFNVHPLLDALDSFDPDVVYVWNLMGLGGLGLLACLQYLGVPWVWHLMDKVPRDLCNLPPRGESAQLARLVHHYLEGTYLACSRRVVAETNDGTPLLRGEVQVLPNWVVGQAPPPREAFYTGGRLRIVSAAAQLCPEKGTDLLIESAALLRAGGHEDFVIDLYGRVPDESLPALLQRHGLGGHVHLRGPRTQRELAELYPDYDVFAFPTWEREPFGFAPLEAAAYGCVPVITNSCGVGEWLAHEVHCLKAERGAEAFAGVLADVLEGRIELAPLGRRVARVVWRDFHLDGVLPRIEQALRRAAGRARAGAGDAGRAYHLAVLAEKLTQVMVQESLAV